MPELRWRCGAPGGSDPRPQRNRLHGAPRAPIPHAGRGSFQAVTAPWKSPVRLLQESWPLAVAEKKRGSGELPGILTAASVEQERAQEVRVKKIGPKGMTAARSGTGSQRQELRRHRRRSPGVTSPSFTSLASPQCRARSSPRAGTGQRGAREGWRATGSAMGSVAAAPQGRASLLINVHSLLLQQQAHSSHSSLSANA